MVFEFFILKQFIFNIMILKYFVNEVNEVNE